MLESLLDIPGTKERLSLFEDGCPTSRLTLLPHQHAQASLSTGAGGFGLASAEARRISASVGSMTLPEVLADLSGAIGEKVRRELPDSDLVRRIWKSVRDLRDVHGVSEEAMANIVPEAGGTAPFEQENKVPQGSRLRTYCQHTTPNRQAQTKPSTDWGSW